jgi:hypothetical protein
MPYVVTEQIGHAARRTGVSSTLTPVHVGRRPVALARRPISVVVVHLRGAFRGAGNHPAPEHIAFIRRNDNRGRQQSLTMRSETLRILPQSLLLTLFDLSECHME